MYKEKINDWLVVGKTTKARVKWLEERTPPPIRGKKLGPPQTTAVKQVHFAKRKTRGEAARLRRLKAKERQKVPAAKKLRQRTVQQSLAYLAFG